MIPHRSRVLFGLSSALLLLLVSLASAQIVVTATSGTTGPTPYTTLRAAFNALNAGTHTGQVAISVQGNTTETSPAVLNGIGASYQTLTITPSGGSWTISGSFSGAVIQLNAASFVTIDGRINGSGRNLTVSNTATSSAAGGIWLSSTGGIGASNNVIRNLEIACGTTEVLSFGIFSGGEGLMGVANGGENNNYNEFSFNRVVRARYGILVRGITTNRTTGTTITDNIVGPAAFGSDQIGKTGIFCAFCTNVVVSRNTVQFVGGTLATTASASDRVGIAIGTDAWSVSGATGTAGSGYVITQNNIHDIVEERGSSAVGLLLSSSATTNATNNLVANNFINNVRANGTGDNQVCGLGISGGINDRVVYNTIILGGDQDPSGTAATTVFGNAIRIPLASSTTHGNLTLANNSVSVDANSDTAGVHYYAITVNTAYSFGSGFSNYNNLYINTANPQVRTGGLNSTATGNTATSEYAGLANWRTVFTPTQDLGTLQTNPLHVSPADLHLQPTSPNIGQAVAISGVTTDLDGQIRDGTPDIGADEYVTGVPPTFTSANAAVFTVGVTSSFNVTATGPPTPTFSLDLGGPPEAVYLSPSGLLSGQPAPKFGGSTFQFNIRASNGFPPDAIQAFTLRVNRRPAGGTAVLTALKNVNGTIPLAELRSVSTDPDGDSLTVSSVSPTSAQGGTVVLGPSFVTYSPPPGYSGPDSFSFVVTDGFAGSTGTGTVNVIVSASTASLSILSFTVGSGAATVVAQGIQGVTYMVQRSTDLVSAWANLTGPISPGANGRIEFTDPMPLPTRNFYRVVVP